jgi:hypothetical protein
MRPIGRPKRFLRVKVWPLRHHVAVFGAVEVKPKVTSDSVAVDLICGSRIVASADEAYEIQDAIPHSRYPFSLAARAIRACSVSAGEVRGR